MLNFILTGTVVDLFDGWMLYFQALQQSFQKCIDSAGCITDNAVAVNSKGTIFILEVHNKRVQCCLCVFPVIPLSCILNHKREVFREKL